MKILVLCLTTLFTTNLFAKCVNLTNQKENIILTWTAFKTPAKAGVNGTFDKIDLQTPKEAKSLGEFVSKTTFKIDTKSVSTKDKGRDRKLAEHFFNFAGKSMISGKFLSMKDNTLEVEITMNGVKKVIPMSLEQNTEKLTFVATGYVDVFDFALNGQLSAINKACYALHKGKTWSDVALKLEAQLSSCKK